MTAATASAPGLPPQLGGRGADLGGGDLGQRPFATEQGNDAIEG
ncbi:hypothetical protein ACWGH8_18135 [Nonomuraea muscovyensis]|uniref:Uncharacterized protein n=1 Tax=Nonomuraea muscovyensis TaxID=1124761 RepID=A0A7X0C864_9ACTN|nr:hypothetical protein [Nonomuraea muscovyensis]MBB6348896.1 hypothetical protein [Nonomuraea muscovyensis]